MSNTTYCLQVSFSALGEENIKELGELRKRLKPLMGKPLRTVYNEFDLVPSQVKPEDHIEHMNVIQATRADDAFGFFTMLTETHGMRHITLWTEICKSYYPGIRTAVIGSGSDESWTCESLYTPDNLKPAPPETPPLPV